MRIVSSSSSTLEEPKWCSEEPFLENNAAFIKVTRLKNDEAKVNHYQYGEAILWLRFLKSRIYLGNDA